MQLRKGKGNVKSITKYKKKEGDSIRAYCDRFTLTTLNVPDHEEFLVIGAFTQGLPPGLLSKKMQRTIPQSRDELNYIVEKYLRQIKGVERKEANLKVGSSVYIKQEEVVSCPNNGY